MAKTANINVRIDPKTKASAEQLFSSFGITVTDAINIFLHKSLDRKSTRLTPVTIESRMPSSA